MTQCKMQIVRSVLTTITMNWTMVKRGIRNRKLTVIFQLKILWKKNPSPKSRIQMKKKVQKQRIVMTLKLKLPVSKTLLY